MASLTIPNCYCTTSPKLVPHLSTPSPYHLTDYNPPIPIDNVYHSNMESWLTPYTSPPPIKPSVRDGMAEETEREYM